MSEARGAAPPSNGAGDPPSRGVLISGIVVGVLAVSSAAILIRIADAHPLAIAFWRCAGGALVLAPFSLRSRRDAPPLDATQWKQLAGAGLFLALHFALWITSLDYTTVASSVTLVAMSPIFVGLGARVFLGEPPSRRTWIGLGLTVAGAVVIGAGDLAVADLGREALLGDLLALGGAVTVAGYLLVGRAARRRLPVTVYASAVYGIAALLLLPACLLVGADLVGFGPITWLAIAGLIVGPQLFGHTVFNALLAYVTATVVAIVVLAEPVAAGVLAWLVLAELPATLFWLGAPLILGGVYVAVTRRGGRTS